MDPDHVDVDTFTELQQTLGVEFAAELVDTFLEEAPGILAQLRTAVIASDADTYRRAAHSLKSNAMTFGALELANMARDVELGGFVGDPGGDTGVLDALDVEYAAAAAKLHELSHG